MQYIDIWFKILKPIFYLRYIKFEKFQPWHCRKFLAAKVAIGQNKSKAYSMPSKLKSVNVQICWWKVVLDILLAYKRAIFFKVNLIKPKRLTRGLIFVLAIVKPLGSRTSIILTKYFAQKQ